MEQQLLFDFPSQAGTTANLDSINNTAAIWTGLKQYSWMKLATKVPDSSQANTVPTLVDASQDNNTPKDMKKRKKADTSSNKKLKTTPHKDDTKSSNNFQSDEQIQKKPKTKIPKQKTPKKSTSKPKTPTQTPNIDETRTTNSEQEVIEQSLGPALQILELPQDTPTKKRRTKTSEQAQIEDKEPKKPSTYPCPVEGCGKVFDRKGTLNRHMSSHSDERNFKCNVCEKAFKLKGELVRHYKSHTSKQFECTHPGCGQKFSFECNLERHVFTIHMKVKNFECPHCQKVFAQPTDLERHLLVHTGERPFSCRWCDAKFKQLGHLQTHEKRKHDVTKVSEQQYLQAALKEERALATSAPKTKEESSSAESESFESDKEVPASAPTRRSSRTASQNVLYKFDFSDSESS